MLVTKKKPTYSFGSGLAAKLWGASPWIVNHAISFQTRASPRHKQHYYQVIQMRNLPCINCQQAFALFQQTHPYDDQKYPSLWIHAHNHVNKDQGRPEVSYEQAEALFASLSPDIWLLALIDFLVACAVYQLSPATKVTYTLVQVPPEQVPSFAYSHLLPLHQFVIFLLKSSLLTTIADSKQHSISKFLQAAYKWLRNPKLYDIEYLQKKYPGSSGLLYQPFVRRLQKVRDFVFPEEYIHKLEHRAKLLALSHPQ